MGNLTMLKNITTHGRHVRVNGNIGSTTEANKATYKEAAPLTTTDKIKH
jgi:hypothetical protein